MPGRRELTDAEWALLAPPMPHDAPKGKKWAEHRKVINAILFRTRTGIPWREAPEHHGPWETAAGRHRRWCIDGTWQSETTETNEGPPLRRALPCPALCCLPR